MIYPFICATLPALTPEQIPEMSVKEFDEVMEKELSAGLYKRMLYWDSGKSGVKIYDDLRRFQEYLRFRIAQMRAEKLNRQATFTEPDEFYGEVDFALAPTASATPIEREKIVDAACWRKLDDLEIGHDLDFEYLCIYRLRLQMLQKYAVRNESAGRENFEAALEKLSERFNEQ